MESIKEKSENLYPDKKVVLARGNTCLSCGRVKRESFEAGANYVLDAIEEFITTMNLCSNAAEKFYKLDLMADIHEFIEQLKSNQ